MVDYRRFLGASTELTLPYLGGTFLETGTRRLRVEASARPSLGWHLFKVSGRNAVATAPAEPIDLSDRPSKVGHFAPTAGGGYLVTQDGAARRLELLPEDEPLALSVLRAREWHDGSWLYGESQFESEVEELVRQRLDERRGCDDVSGVGASLRVAFAISLAARIGRELSIPIAPVELLPSIRDIAARGEPAAREALEATDARRRERAREAAEAHTQATIQSHARAAVRRAAHERRGAAAPSEENAEERAIAALEHAGARFLSARRTANRSLEVRYEFMHERFITVVDAITLQVWDAGVCLSGADAELTLDSLPSAIREAIETDVLVITSR
ncbi:MAG: hypothetical protein U0414_05540 [Polyangiaceae bacterium]